MLPRLKAIMLSHMLSTALKITFGGGSGRFCFLLEGYQTI